jgi:AcrR family transcriptional regulator
MSSGERRAFVPRKRQQRGARRVDEIVQAAAMLFAERGFEGTSMNAIAKAAGLTIGSIYQYFPSRDAIVDAVADYYLAAFRVQEREALAQPLELSMHALIHRSVLTLFDFHTRYGGVKAFLDADPRRARSIRTIHEEVTTVAPLIGRYYPDKSYEELARVVFAVSSIIRGSAASLPAVETPEQRAAFVDDIALAVEQYTIARLGPPIDLPLESSSTAQPRQAPVVGLSRD